MSHPVLVGLLVAVVLIALGVAGWAWSCCAAGGRADDRIAEASAREEREARERRALLRRRPDMQWLAGDDISERQRAARLN